VYFGYPHAHEDDAERALQAGLAIVDAIARVNADLAATRVRLAVRIGVHSGVVVAGVTGGPEREKQMFGHTMNLAARIQSGAPPDSVVASAATLRLVGGRFVTRDLGARELKGIAEPVAIHQVIGPIETRDRLEAAATRLTPFVGREHELALMLDRWQQVREGHGQVVLLTGEAGIGKSRLVRVLRERLAGQSLLWLESHGSPYHEHSAFYPVVELLERALYLRREGSREEQAANFERALAAAGLRVEDVLPLFASLSLPLHGRQAARHGSRRRALRDGPGLRLAPLARRRARRGAVPRRAGAQLFGADRGRAREVRALHEPPHVGGKALGLASRRVGGPPRRGRPVVAVPGRGRRRRRRGRRGDRDHVAPPELARERADGLARPPRRSHRTGVHFQ
jgi:hypothetical protein